MTVHAETSRSYRATIATSIAVAGCLALAARPAMTWPAFGVTLTVGAAALLAPTLAADEHGSAIAWIVVTAIAVGAFATIRLSAAVPPAPWSARTALTVVGAAIAEELFFRRFLYGALLRRGVAFAIAGSALAFALVHIPAYGAHVFPIDLAAGFVLSWQRWASGTWTSPAVSHIVANLMVIL